MNCTRCSAPMVRGQTDCNYCGPVVSKPTVRATTFDIWPFTGGPKRSDLPFMISGIVSVLGLFAAFMFLVMAQGIQRAEEGIVSTSTVTHGIAYEELSREEQIRMVEADIAMRQAEIEQQIREAEAFAATYGGDGRMYEDVDRRLDAMSYTGGNHL